MGTLGCLAGFSFPDAEQACASRGLRLCTKVELASGLCCGSGCGFDNQLAWSATQVSCTALCDARTPAATAQLKVPCNDPRVADTTACNRMLQVVEKLEM